jgi:hypothetical protein
VALISPSKVGLTGIPVVVWSGLNTADTVEPLVIPSRTGSRAAVQIGGDFGGATVKIQVSNDGITYFDLSDVDGDPVSATANAIFEISTSAVFIRPDVSGGSEDDIDVTLCLRGPASA